LYTTRFSLDLAFKQYAVEQWDQHCALASIYRFDWQGASATVVNMKSGVVQVSRRVLNLESVPRPVWDAKALRYIIGRLVVAGHRFRGRPSKIVVQHLSQCTVVG